MSELAYSSSLYSLHGVRAYRSNVMSQRSLPQGSSRTNLNFPPLAISPKMMKLSLSNAQQRRSKSSLVSDERMDELTAWAASSGGSLARAARPITPSTPHGLPRTASRLHGSVSLPKLQKPQRAQHPQDYASLGRRQAKTPPPFHEALRERYETALDTKYKDQRTAFMGIDRDRSGGLTAEELLRSMVSMQVNASEEEVDALIKACDLNGDGHIDFAEFQHGIMKLAQAHGGSYFQGGNNQEPHSLGKPTMVEATEEELAKYVADLRNAIETKYSMLREAFQAIDTDRSNHLSKREIVEAVQHFALPIPLSHIGEVFDKVLDVDQNGNVSWSEFCEKLKPYELI